MGEIKLRLKYDVVVVGGGPGGLMAAVTSAKLGCSVILIEKSRAFGYPIHDSGVTSYSIIKEFDLRKKVVAQEIDGIVFVSPSGHVVSGELEKRKGCILKRQELNKELAKKASNVGVTILMPARVTAPIIKNGKVSGIKVTSFSKLREIKARLVIDASGLDAVLAREVGLHPGLKKIRLGYGAQFDMCNVDLEFSRFLEFYLGNKIAPGGYGYIFPKGGGNAYVGMAISRGREKTARHYLENFIKNHPVSSKIVRNAQPLEYHTGVFPIGPKLDKFVCDGLIVVGDAACQASPLFGEGIRYALKAGKIAGEVTAEALESNDTSQRNLKKFEKRVKREIWPNYDFLYKLHLHTCAMKDNDWERFVNISEKLFQTNSGRHFLTKFIHGNIDKWDILKIAPKFLY